MGKACLHFLPPYAIIYVSNLITYSHSMPVDSIKGTSVPLLFLLDSTGWAFWRTAASAHCLEKKTRGQITIGGFFVTVARACEMRPRNCQHCHTLFHRSVSYRYWPAVRIAASSSCIRLWVRYRRSSKSWAFTLLLPPTPKAYCRSRYWPTDPIFIWFCGEREPRLMSGSWTRYKSISWHARAGPAGNVEWW